LLVDNGAVAHQLTESTQAAALEGGGGGGSPYMTAVSAALGWGAGARGEADFHSRVPRILIATGVMTPPEPSGLPPFSSARES